MMVESLVMAFAMLAGQTQPERARTEPQDPVPPVERKEIRESERVKERQETIQAPRQQERDLREERREFKEEPNGREEIREEGRLRRMPEGRDHGFDQGFLLQQGGLTADLPWWTQIDFSWMDQGMQQQGLYGGRINRRLTSLSDCALIHLKVPADAEVLFEGSRTMQRGEIRSFISPPLEDGNFTYLIQARWRGEDGRPIEKSTMLMVHAGDSLSVNLETAGLLRGPPQEQRQAPIQRTKNGGGR